MVDQKKKKRFPTQQRIVGIRFQIRMNSVLTRNNKMIHENEQWKGGKKQKIQNKKNILNKKKKIE